MGRLGLQLFLQMFSFSTFTYSDRIKTTQMHINFPAKKPNEIASNQHKIGAIITNRPDRIAQNPAIKIYLGAKSVRKCWRQMNWDCLVYSPSPSQITKFGKGIKILKYKHIYIRHQLYLYHLKKKV